MTCRKNFPERITQRHKEALERQAAYDELTASQKLTKLDEAFGEGNGAKKVRAQLDQIVTIEKLKAKHNTQKDK